jgi:hypothetical protein
MVASLRGKHPHMMNLKRLRAQLRKELRIELQRDLAIKGGHARRDALTKAERSAIAKKAARARWGPNRKRRRAA